MNADDYYGKTVMETGRSFFQQEKHAHGLFSYALSDTLSEHGGVSRGICAVDDQGFLKDIVECHGITKDAEGLRCQDGTILSESDRVSMNLWFFQATIFEHLSSYFQSFFAQNHQELTAECYLPFMVHAGIQADQQRALTDATLSGWALGETAFVANLQRQTDRRVVKGRAGRPFSGRNPSSSST